MGLNLKNYPLLILGGCAFLFITLIIKDPFSTRTIIPNFEPYPDTFNYVVPALSLSRGEPFSMYRDGRLLVPHVPPLYSIALIPFYLIHSDPRMFYFTNFVLSLTSFGLMYLVLKQITPSKAVQFICLAIFSTSFYIYTFPTLAMAENLTMVEFLFGLWLLLKPLTLKSIFIGGLLSVSFYATKFADAPLSASFLLFFVLKVFTPKHTKNISLEFSKIKIKQLFWFAIAVILALGLFFTYEQFQDTGSSLGSIVVLIGDALKAHSSVTQKLTADEQAASAPFSFGYIAKNLPQYLNSIFGHSITVLWYNQPMFPSITGILGFAGLLMGLAFKKLRFMSFVLLFGLGASILFMSSFYVVDGRYIYTIIPTMIFGLAFFLIILRDLLIKNKFKKIYPVLLIILIGFYLMLSGKTVVKQISLNLRHSETPWYYVAVQNTNTTVDREPKSSNKPVLISALPPYFIDFYANGKYIVLPLSEDQDFRRSMNIVWGPNDYSDLNALYKSYLQKGYPVYLQSIMPLNSDLYRNSIESIKNNFNMTELNSGCYNACNVYKLEMKND